MDYAIVHTSIDGTIEAWLGAAERVFGYTAAEAIGMSLSALFTPGDLQLGLDAQEIAVAMSRGRSEDDRWHVRKDGTRFWASGVLTRLNDEAGRPIELCKVLRDKTDVRTQIAALENRVAYLHGALEAARSSVETVTHELRNPLQPILSAIALLQHPQAEAKGSEKTLQILANQVNVLQRLIFDLDTSIVAPDRPVNLEMESVNLNAVVTESVEGLRDAFESRQQRWSVVLPNSVIEIFADPPRLRQMLANLLGNSLKYTQVDGHVDVSISVEADMAVFRVEDDGVGISPDMLPRIFELFTREGRQPQIAGKGVGLAMVKRYAAAHGGSVEARSAGPGLGAMFSLRLPLATPQGDASST